MSEVEVGTQSLDPGRARQLTDRIKVALEGTWQMIVEAYQGRAWVALGYPSWDDYCTREFGTSRPRLPREERDEVVLSLRDAGMSVRAITGATGLGYGSVHRALGTGDISTDPIGSPDSGPVVGLDGRQYAGPASTTREVLARKAESVALRAQGLTQVEIAQRLGVAQATVSQDLSSMDQLASAHDVDLKGLVMGGQRLDVRELAAKLHLDARPGRDLARVAAAVVRYLDANASMLLNDVILADGWVEDDEREAAIAALVPGVADVLLMLAEAAAQISAATIRDTSVQLRWTQTIAQAKRKIARAS